MLLSACLMSIKSPEAKTILKEDVMFNHFKLEIFFKSSAMKLQKCSVDDETWAAVQRSGWQLKQSVVTTDFCGIWGFWFCKNLPDLRWNTSKSYKSALFLRRNCRDNTSKTGLSFSWSHSVKLSQHQLTFRPYSFRPEHLSIFEQI